MQKHNTYLLLPAMDWKSKLVSWFKMGIYWIAHWFIFAWLTSYCFYSFTFSPNILNAAFHDSSKNSINSLREIWLSSSLSKALNVSINSITTFYTRFFGFYHSRANWAHSRTLMIQSRFFFPIELTYFLLCQK